jgi:FtsH-binding integral membrane protein
MYDAPSTPTYPLVADAEPSERAAFIRRTYWHLAMAILAFVGIEIILFQSGIVVPIMGLMLVSKYSWLVVLGAFMGVSYLTERWAETSPSVWVQYTALAIYVVAEAIIFVPMLGMAVFFSSPNLLPNAVAITGLLFLGLTMTAFTTRKDFSFLGGILCVGGCIALGVIVASIVFGFELGMIFSAVMILFAGAAILYSTSKVIHKYNTSQHVAAALSLFAAIALLFWYVLRFLMAFSRKE